MRMLKKRLLTLLVAACLLLSLSACGSAPEASSEPNASTEQTEQTTAEAESSEDTTEPAEQPADAETEETKEAEETSDSSLPTLEEFMNSDMMKTTIEAAIGQTESEDFTVDLYAEGNQLHFDYTVTSLPETTEEERALYADVLKGTMESAGTTFNAVASQVKDSVSNEVVGVVISYLDGAGNVIYSVTYSSADAVA